MTGSIITNIKSLRLGLTNLPARKRLRVVNNSGLSCDKMKSTTNIAACGFGAQLETPMELGRPKVGGMVSS